MNDSVYSEVIRSACEDSRTLDLYRAVVNRAYLRVVNYHNTSACNIPQFQKELAAFSKNFSSISIQDIDRLFETQKWHLDKPGLIPAVYEGWRNGFDVMLPLLEEASFRGWYFIPAFFPDVPVKEQFAFGQPRSLRVSKITRYADERYAMTWDEIRRVAKTNEICCHTGTHFHMDEDTTDQMLRSEIIDSKARLEDEIGRSVDVFCWNKGEEVRRVPRAVPYLQEAGYKYVVSNLKFEKIG